ncbi:MAG: diaminopimelate epimerase [Armatimonadetes bacterium]|nr:diaminopimelate epimerase [Armatimonadota bacterium]
MKFTKMHGLGNDFVVVDGFTETLSEDRLPFLAREVCDRHFGIGADGLILLLPSQQADLQMRIFNADGSEADACGNGIRCLGKFAYERGKIRETRFTVETKAGLVPLELEVRNGFVEQVRVDIATPSFARGKIPMVGPPDEEAMGERLQVGGRELEVTCLSVGNPHCVAFLPAVDDEIVRGLGPLIERYPAFPCRINAEFVEVLDRRTLRMRVWERGAGETQACGTGACAALVAAARSGRTERRATVRLLGGDLFIEWTDENRILMTGPATQVYVGEY